MKHLGATKNLVLGLLIASFFSTVTLASTTGTSQNLSTELLQDKENLITSFTATSEKLFGEYDRNITPLKNTADYQSLLCLGLMDGDSILADMEDELLVVKDNMLQDFVNLNSEIFQLYNEYSVGLISDAEFTTEYNRLALEVGNFNTTYSNLVSQVDQEYLQKIFNLSLQVQNYSDQNEELLGDIHDKIVLIQDTIDSFSIVEQGILEMNNSLGINQSTFFDTLETMRNKAVYELQSELDAQGQIYIARNPAYTNLVNELSAKETTIMSLFKFDLDEKMTNIFGDRYNRDQYLYLKEQVNLLKSNFYENNELSCTKVLGTNLDLDTYGDGLNEEVTELVQNLEKGLEILSYQTTQGTSLKDEIMLNYQDFYTTRYQKDVNEFTTYAESLIETRKNNNPTTSTTTEETTTTSSEKYPTDFVFNRSFYNGEIHNDIKVLQNLLIDLGYYTDAIDGSFGPKTSNAVYLFQQDYLDASLLTNSLSHGHVGPSTQTALNEALQKLLNGEISSSTTEETTTSETTTTTTTEILTQEDMILQVLHKIGNKFSSVESFQSLLINGLTKIDESLKDTSLSVKQRLFILDLKSAVNRYLDGE